MLVLQGLSFTAGLLSCILIILTEIIFIGGMCAFRKNGVVVYLKSMNSSDSICFASNGEGFCWDAITSFQSSGISAALSFFSSSL